MTPLSCTSISDSIIIEGKVSGLKNQNVKLLKLDLETNEPVAVDSFNSKDISINTVCTKEYDPVCGCDGYTYSNPCTAKSHGVSSYKMGKC